MKCEKCDKELNFIIAVTDNRASKGHIEYLKCRCEATTDDSDLS